MTAAQEIGYLCSRGHYLFTADDEEIISCGSRRVATILLVSPDGVPEDLFDEAQESLRRVINDWRNSE